MNEKSGILFVGKSDLKKLCGAVFLAQRLGEQEMGKESFRAFLETHLDKPELCLWDWAQGAQKSITGKGLYIAFSDKE